MKKATTSAPCALRGSLFSIVGVLSLGLLFTTTTVGAGGGGGGEKQLGSPGV